MSVITDTWRQLVRRRLWPVVLLLLAGVAAVPVLLARDPAPVPPPGPAAETASPGDGLAKPVVELASTDPQENGRRHVLGDRKDPFKPAPPPKPKHHHASAPHTAGAASTPSASTPSGGGTFTPPSSGASGGTSFTPPSSSGGGGSSPALPPVSTPAPPASNPPAPKKPRYPLYSLKVRFGDASGTLATTRIQKLDPLPDADAPVVIYTGPGDDKRTAVFLVDASVTPVGDGKCEPYEADCQRVVLHEGDTEFFDVKDETGAVTTTYELDLLDIVTPSGSKQHHSRRAHRSPASRNLASTAARVARVVRVLRPSL